MTAADLAALIEGERFLAIIRIADEDQSLLVAAALAAAGVRVLELSLSSTPYAVLERACQAAPAGVAVGAGSVVSVAQARDAVSAGAAFLVSPHVDPAVIAWAREADVLHVPGGLTPTELLLAAGLGAPLVKLFPASGFGPSYVREVLAPAPSLRLVPTGGVDAANAAAYLAAGAVALGVGGGLTSTPGGFSTEAVEANVRGLRTAIDP